MVEYNAVSWPVADLLSDIRLEARIDDNAVDYTDTVLLRIATSTIWTKFSSALAKAGGSRLLRVVTRDASADYKNADADEYVLPPMSVGDNVTDVWFKTSDATEEYRLNLISLQTAPDYVTPSDTGAPRWYALTGGRIRVFPKPDTSAGTLKIVYARRHGELVPATSCRAITSVSDSGGTRVIIASTEPASWTAAAKYDLIDSFHPHRLQDSETTFSSVSGGSLIHDEAYATASLRFKVGQYLALAGQTCFVQLPLELREPLVEAVAAKVLMQIGDVQTAIQNERRALESLVAIADALVPRVRGRREKLINHYSPFRRNISRAW